MNIDQIMSKPVVTVEMDDSLATIKDIFDNTRFHHLLVVDEEGSLVGIISDRDLLGTISPYVGTPSEGHRDLATLNKRAHQVMRRNPIVLGEEASISDAISKINEHNVTCIPVINAQNRPVGIVTWRDILRNLEAS